MSTARSIAPEEKAFVDTIVRWAVMLIAIGQAAAGYTDTDIWGHMAIGQDVLRTGRFLWVDPYSFTHDQPWVNHEWLWDVSTAAVYRLGGLTALVALRACLIAGVLWTVDRVTRGAPGWVRIVAICIVGIECVGQWRSLRPQMATLTLYAVLLTHLNASWLPLLFGLWANVHGGWVFGLGAVVTHAVWQRTRRSALLALASVGASLVNPYGLGLWFAIADAMQRGWRDLTEWQPVWRISAGAEALPLWILVAVATALLVPRVKKEGWPWAWTCVALAVSFNSRRLTALAAVTAAVLLLQRWDAAAGASGFAWTPTMRRTAGGVVAAAVAVAFAMARPTAKCFPPLPGWRAPEPDAVAFLRAHDATRVVPHFDYGEYAIFHLRDRLKVAIDNRRETVYSEAAVEANQRFTDGRDPQYPDRIGADAVWWPVDDRAVITGLEARGWVKRFEGPRTAILMKTAGPLVRGAPAVGTPCFPNP